MTAGDYDDPETPYYGYFFGPESDFFGGGSVFQEAESWRELPGSRIGEAEELPAPEHSTEDTLDLYFSLLSLEVMDRQAFSASRHLYAEFTSKHDGIFFFDDDPELDLSEFLGAVESFQRKAKYW